MRTTIEWTDILSLSQRLGCQPCMVQAIISTEVGTKSQGFLPDGRPKILFEAHQFYKRLRGHGTNPDEHMVSHPNILSKSYNQSLYKGGAAEYDRLDEAMSIHRAAALESASWGTFQIMGFNYKELRYKNVFEFVADMENGIEGQIEAFARYIEGAKRTRPDTKTTVDLVQAFRDRDFVAIAYAYNGPLGVQNGYNDKLVQHYVSCLNTKR